MACVAAVQDTGVVSAPGARARWPTAVRGAGPRVATASGASSNPAAAAANGVWMHGDSSQPPNAVPPTSGAAQNNRYTVDIWQQNLQDQGGLSPSPSPRTTAVATASLDPLSLEAFLCGPQQQNQQQQQQQQQQQSQQQTNLQHSPNVQQQQQQQQQQPAAPKLGCVTSITSPLKLLNNNNNSNHGSYNNRLATNLPPRHLQQSGLPNPTNQHQVNISGSIDSTSNNNQGELNVMSEVSMMPLSLAAKRPAEDVHLTDSSAGLKRKFLESYKSRREDSIGGSDPSSSPHPEDSELDEDVDMPAIDSHQPFPCVWLDSSNGMPLTISPIEPDSKYVVIEPTDPAADDNCSSQENAKTENAEKPASEHAPTSVTPAEKTDAVPPTTESHVTNGHFPEEGSEADPAPPTNNGSTPPPISKTASVADALGTPLRSPTLTSSQPATPTQSMVNIANSMGQSIFPLSESQQAGSPLMNSKMLSNVCNKVLSDVQGMNGLRTTPTTTIDENGENLEVCPECHKVFKRKVYLQRHMEREHWSTAKVFKCDDCSYETKHQSNLSVHRRIHTGERPYHCGACGQRYTQGHLLKSHIRSRHGGNMELYNLEKKSDSTRGRKSLDAKHEMSPFIKQEKINSLVQQLEQQKLQHMMASPTMSHFMNNMSYINHLRPLMTNPLALSNNLLAGGTPNPRMLLGNMQNGLNNSMMSLQQNLSLMVNNSFSNMAGMSPSQPNMSPIYTSSPSSTTATPTEANGIKLPLKIPEMQAQVGNTGAQRATTNQSFGSTSPQSTSATSMDWQDQNGPQDLTVKKSQGQALSQVSPSSRSSQSSSSYQPTTNGSIADGTTESQRDSPVPDDLKTLQAEVSKGLKRPCEDENCAHAKKLKLLRRNIVRMLSVLTPDLSMDAGLNYDSDQVDELLHEVIYSNMEDIMEESPRKT